MRNFLSLLFLCLLLTSVSVKAQVPERAGWWKFDNTFSPFTANVGQDLESVGTYTAVPGPVPGNNAVSIEPGSYLKMDHQLYGNGGGSMVNEYTLMIDFSIPETEKWHSFMQTSEDNSTDGDLFINNGSNAIGTQATGYTNKGVAADTWYRMVVVVQSEVYFKIFINGELWLDGVPQITDGRFALAPKLLLFADEDGEDNTIVCSEVAIWDVVLDDDQVAQLGDASGNRARTRSKVGWWKFDDAQNLLKAEVGNDLQLTGTQESVTGPESGNLAVKVGLGSYLKIAHEIALNGSETKVNEYSIQMDFKVPEAGLWHAFFQTDQTNSSDAELFTKNADNTIGTLATGYSSNSIAADTWYRMVVTVKNGSFFKVYLNGILWLDGTQQDIDGRFALENNLLIFGDDDGDDGQIICSDLSLYEVALTELEVQELGGDPAGAIPERVGWWKFDDSSDLLKATIGQDLIISGFQTEANGPTEGNGATLVPSGSYLKMIHGIGENGGGILTNEYTLQIDFSLPDADAWHSFMQTSEDNSTDGDLFTNSSNKIGTSSTGYTSLSVSAGVWYRMMVVVKNGGFFKIYINGEPWLESSGQTVDGRFALADALLVFADEDGEDAAIYCSELGIWDVNLTAEQVAKLGGASGATGIHNHLLKTDGLGQNYPNPFNTLTTFPYEIMKAGTVSFRVLDMSGNIVDVVNKGIVSPGKYTLDYNSEKLSNGVYYFQMMNNENVSVRKMIVIK